MNRKRKILLRAKEVAKMIDGKAVPADKNYIEDEYSYGAEIKKKNDIVLGIYYSEKRKRYDIIGFDDSDVSFTSYDNKELPSASVLVDDFIEFSR